MDNKFLDGKNLLVGMNTSKLLTLKRDLLLFDGFIDADDGADFPEICKSVLDQMKIYVDDIYNEVKYPFVSSMLSFSELSSKGLVRSFNELSLESSDLNFESAITAAGNLSGKLKELELKARSNLGIRIRPQNEIENEMVYVATEKLRDKNALATPRFNTFAHSPKNVRSTVTQVVLEKFPFPDESISIDEILDFKADNDSIRKLGSLQVLISRLSREETSPVEVCQEIEQLLLEARSVMKAKKFAYKESKLTKAVRIAESVVKGSLGDLFKMRDEERAEKSASNELGLSLEQMLLMESEVSAEWKHVAYILKTRMKYCND